MISRLLTEHDHIQKMLNLLEILFLNLCRGRTPDYPMILSIIVYVQEYPEQTHHPLEDAIFSHLIKKKREGSKLAAGLIKDHTELEIITRKLRKYLELLKSGDFTEREGLPQKLLTFLVRQRNHLYVEEMKLYPLINSTFTEHDWSAIEAIVPDINDPVFGERTQSAYELLYREIQGNANQDNIR